MPANPQNSPEQFRVAGSGLTAFFWNGSVIGFAQSLSETAPQPVAAPEAIQPMDAPRPLEILVPQAIGPGTLQVQLFERYTTKVWDSMLKLIDDRSPAGDNRANVTKNQDGYYYDLVDVFNRMANLGKGVTVQKRVYAPDRIGQTQWHADVYHNCKITDIRDDEDINIGTMSVIKNMSMMYTHKTRSHYGAPQAR